MSRGALTGSVPQLPPGAPVSGKIVSVGQGRITVAASTPGLPGASAKTITVTVMLNASTTVEKDTPHTTSAQQPPAPVVPPPVPTAGALPPPPPTVASTVTVEPAAVSDLMVGQTVIVLFNIGVPAGNTFAQKVIIELPAQQ